VVPELLPLLGFDPLVEREEVFDEVDDLDLDDFDGALATAVL
jgi:hypothetical protein|tara:strand:- start:622 stop:747 length:126 start_codon:yes stop_codon:yes gene_type:complete